jgi:hypothetical protein
MAAPLKTVNIIDLPIIVFCGLRDKGSKQPLIIKCSQNVVEKCFSTPQEKSSQFTLEWSDYSNTKDHIISDSYKFNENDSTLQPSNKSLDVDKVWIAQPDRNGKKNGSYKLGTATAPFLFMLKSNSNIICAWLVVILSNERCRHEHPLDCRIKQNIILDWNLFSSPIKLDFESSNGENLLWKLKATLKSKISRERASRKKVVPVDSLEPTDPITSAEDDSKSEDVEIQVQPKKSETNVDQFILRKIGLFEQFLARYSRENNELKQELEQCKKARISDDQRISDLHRVVTQISTENQDLKKAVEKASGSDFDPSIIYDRLNALEKRGYKRGSTDT